MKTFFDTVYFGNTVRDWLTALLLICGCIVLLRLVRTRVLIKVKQWTSRSNNTVDDFVLAAIEKAVLPVLYILALYAGLSYLKLSVQGDRVIQIFVLVVITFYVLRLITFIAEYLVSGFLKKHDESDIRNKQTRGLILILNLVLYILGCIFLLDNLGYNVTTVIAGLGISGIAIALAAQTILGDLFSYFVIFFDKPFEIGDFIVVDDKRGTIEYIGLKTTRLRALSGEQIIFSNTNLTNSRVHNHKRLEKRRAAFNIAVHADTSHQTLKKIPGLIKNIIEAQPDLVYDRGHFVSFGQTSFNFEFIYYVNNPDYNLYMDRQQIINLQILEVFGHESIRIATPS